MSSLDTIRIGIILPMGLEYARKIAKGLCLSKMDHPEVELQLLSESAEIPPAELIRSPLDGIVAHLPASTLSQLKKISPFSVLTSSREEPGEGDYVVSDDYQIGRMGAEHLIRRGYRDIYFGSRYLHYYSENRFKGFEERASESGVQVTPFNVFHENDSVRIPEVLHQLSSRCGIMAANDYVARRIMSFCEDPKSQIPLQFALLGVDNDSLQQAFCPVELSSIELDGVRVGQVAIERLIARIQNPSLPTEHIAIPPLRVQNRQSTDFFAIEDEVAARALQLMADDLANLPDVHEVVKRIKVPRRTLELKFRKATGRTLARELAFLRVERARDYLRNTDMDIDKIATEVGLPDARMLWLLFKRLTDESPSTYRKRFKI